MKPCIWEHQFRINHYCQFAKFSLLPRSLQTLGGALGLLGSLVKVDSLIHLSLSSNMPFVMTSGNYGNCSSTVMELNGQREMLQTAPVYILASQYFRWPIHFKFSDFHTVTYCKRQNNTFIIVNISRSLLNVFPTEHPWWSACLWVHLVHSKKPTHAK